MTTTAASSGGDPPAPRPRGFFCPLRERACFPPELRAPAPAPAPGLPPRFVCAALATAKVAAAEGPRIRTLCCSSWLLLLLCSSPPAALTAVAVVSSAVAVQPPSTRRCDNSTAIFLARSAKSDSPSLPCRLFPVLPLESRRFPGSCFPAFRALALDPPAAAPPLPLLLLLRSDAAGAFSNFLSEHG